MIQKGNRQQGTPYFISSDNSLKLERVPLNEKLFQENWLQKLIHNNPQVLPIDEIESGFAPLISLGREISTSVGYIDNLYISPNGYLTIVETKLWRNPEAKREVVGQIIDYAKELTTWTFSKLNDSVKASSQLLNNNSKGIFDIIKEFDFLDENQEQLIIDNIDRNLKRGRLLLLIVGDGIRESVEDMVDYLSNTPQIQFTLGLIELQVYKNPNAENDLIVIPNLITRTREITRAIIKIENTTTNNIVSVETDFKEEKLKTQYQRKALTEDDFIDQILLNTEDNEVVAFIRQILEISRKRNFYIDWQTNGCTIKYEPIKGENKITLFRITKTGEFSLGKWEKDDSFKQLEINEKPSIDFAKKTAEILNLPYGNFKHKWDTTIQLKNLEPKFDIFMKNIDEFIFEIQEEIKNVNG